MTQRIFKYELSIEMVQTIEIPKDALITSIQEQHGKLCVWALVDDSHEMENRTFYIYGTGHSIKSHCELEFIDTVQMQGGTLVWHIFERK